ncbi:hypothetical protein Pst134EA_011825 [Puccinia striiformis f. sp. tritici]|uniref:hypothetical protein n=1 Tax=Puccinia striiformis f. sp. tritici TaxID=168172 RepID=UPI00200795BB|nr:hypothetical protein Pst134EA_011825 [Puccinia striiformis f. sp. tritici]KAH9468196.1 hypothetical protein Pst134EA_011825 [Puccinia striiformis f. sp. tritici]
MLSECSVNCHLKGRHPTSLQHPDSFDDHQLFDFDSRTHGAPPDPLTSTHSQSSSRLILYLDATGFAILQTSNTELARNSFYSLRAISYQDATGFATSSTSNPEPARKFFKYSFILSVLRLDSHNAANLATTPHQRSGSVTRTPSKRKAPDVIDSPPISNKPLPIGLSALQQILKQLGIQHRPYARHTTLIKLYKQHLATKTPSPPPSSVTKRLCLNAPTDVHPSGSKIHSRQPSPEVATPVPVESKLNNPEREKCPSPECFYQHTPADSHQRPTNSSTSHIPIPSLESLTISGISQTPFMPHAKSKASEIKTKRRKRSCSKDHAARFYATHPRTSELRPRQTTHPRDSKRRVQQTHTHPDQVKESSAARPFVHSSRLKLVNLAPTTPASPTLTPPHATPGASTSTCNLASPAALPLGQTPRSCGGSPVAQTAVHDELSLTRDSGLLTSYSNQSSPGHDALRPAPANSRCSESGLVDLSQNPTCLASADIICPNETLTAPTPLDDGSADQYLVPSAANPSPPLISTSCPVASTSAFDEPIQPPITLHPNHTPDDSARQLIRAKRKDIAARWPRPTQLTPYEIRGILLRHPVLFDLHDNPVTLAGLYRQLYNFHRSGFPNKKKQRANNPINLPKKTSRCRNNKYRHQDSSDVNFRPL